ncbi:MAG: glycosyltransferase family 4 protein [Acidobacteria bacterium]|nr:glycosyltransferase family 4 protein [Acidobacteriota bacterium]
MKKTIIIATSAVPFYYGGNERLAENLSEQLSKFGYNSEPFFTPRNSYDSFIKLIGGYAANRFTDLQSYPWKNTIDQIISISYPSFVIPHQHHVSWFAHRMREYYDLWPRWLASETTPAGRIKKKTQRFILQSIDNHYISKIEKLYCISNTVKQRLYKWGGFEAETLYPPPEDDQNYHATDYKPYIFTVSRLTSLKRISLLIEALNLTKNNKLKAIIAGEGEEKETLIKLTQKYSLENRIQFTGNITEAEKHELIINSRGIFFAPYNEEYGIVTIEAMKRSKPVITAIDSGGPTDFVDNGETGFIVDPDPGKIAEKLDHLYMHEDEAKRLGDTARNKVKEITWEKTIEKLVVV